MKLGLIARAVFSLVLLQASAAVLGQVRPDLVWRTNRTADARIRDWPLTRVLGRLAGASGWKIYLEPGLNERISVTFTNAPQSEALKLLLGSASYALVPESASGSRLYVYRTSVSQATSLILPEASKKATNWLANELILALPPDSKTDVDKLVQELGGKILAKSEGLNAYRLEFPDAEKAQQAREKLAETAAFDVQDNYLFQRPAPGASSGTSPAALFPIDPKPVSRGDQVTVALVDTPVQPLEGKMKEFLLPSVHVRDDPGELPPEPTHGTSMAQTLLHSMALSKDAGGGESLGNVRLLPIDIYGSGSSTTTFEVAQGLYQAIQSNARVINLSLGGSGESPLVEYLLEAARRKQILVFASAGNSPTTDPTWPAASPNAYAVTAADWSGNIAPYANRGSFIDLKAPGTSRVFYNGQAYLSTGTSTATAFVSGQAAALAARGFNFVQMEEVLRKSFDVNTPPVPRRR